MITSLAEGVKSAFIKIYDLGPETINKFIDAIQTFADRIIPSGADFIINIVQGISQNWDKITQAAETAVGYFKAKIDEAIESAYNWGKDLIMNFVKGVGDFAGKIKEAASNAMAEAKKVMHFSVPDEGPLSDFDTYAPDMMKLFAQGIEDNEDMLKGTVEHAFDFGRIIKDQGVFSPSGVVGTTAAGLPEKNVTVILQLDRTQLGKAVFQLNKEESRRIGVEMTYA